MYHYLIPLLEKKPDHIILRVGTDDVLNYERTEIVDKLLIYSRKTPHDQRYTFKGDNES